MPPVVLPEEVLLQEERYAAKIEEMEEAQEESEGQGKNFLIVTPIIMTRIQ